MTLATEEATGLPEITRLARADIRAAAALLGPEAARYNVDLYYQVQEFRKATANRVRSGDEEPTSVAEWTFRAFATTEEVVKTLLDEYTSLSVIGRWSKSMYGIGPVIAAGLMGHIDIERAPTVGHIWRFAGLDPSVRWAKGERRPWNAQLKTLCWKIGDSFVKFHNRDECIYGKVYEERKALEVSRNEAGQFADQAAQTLTDRNIKDKATRAVYEAGRLPDGRIDLRARRYAVKLFLSHWHHVAFESRFGEPPPKPYILTRPEHTHYVAPPGWPME